MAWIDTLLQATFRGVPFEVLGIDRSNQRAIAEHEYPYTAGADLEDMNVGARRVRVRALFWGDDYEERLADFMSAVQAPGVGELVHPVHGSMMVLAQAWSDAHDAEAVDTATVDVAFIEDQTWTAVFTASSGAAKTDDIVSKADESREAADGALERYLAQAPSFTPHRITALRDGFQQAKNALTRLMSVTTGVKLLLSDLDPLIYPRAYANDLLAIVDRGLQGLPFGGRNILFGASSSGLGYGGSDTLATAGTGAGDFATVVRQLDPETIAVVPPVEAPDRGMLADAAVVQVHAQVHATCAISEAATIIFAGELEEPLLERSDIEALSNQVRTAVDVAIRETRIHLDPEGRAAAATALRALAYAVQDGARAVINQRPPLVRRPAPLAGPMRLVAHAFYGDASRAPEIVRLNRLGRHILVQEAEVLNVYSA